MNGAQLKAVLAITAAVGLVLAARQLARAHAPALGIPTNAAPAVVAGIAWALSTQLAGA